MQPTTREMQAMAAGAGAGQISLDDLRNGHLGSANGGGGGAHDDFLDQMFGSLPPSAWHDLAAGTKPEDGEGMQQFGGAYDESVMLASRLRQHQISGGPGGGAAKQMVLQQLADLSRQGHHHNMMLQGMGGRSPSVGGGGDGGMLLPLTLGNGGSGGDVHALMKAAANSAVRTDNPSPFLELIHFLAALSFSSPRPWRNRESFLFCEKVPVFIRSLLVSGRGRRRLRRLRRIAPATATFPATSTGSQPT